MTIHSHLLDHAGLPQGVMGKLYINPTGPQPYYRPPVPIRQTGTLALTANRLYWSRLVVEQPQTWDYVAIEVTAEAVGKAARLGLYADDGSGTQPGALIADWGTVSVEGVAVKPLSISRGETAPATRWLALYSQDTPTVRAFRPTWPLAGHLTDFTDGYSGWYYDGAYGVLPSPAPAPSGLFFGYSPMIMLRVASYP